MFLTREYKSHIFKPPCNVLLLYSPKQKIVKFHAQKQIGKSHMIDIFTIVRGGANPLLMGGCEGSFCRLFGNFAESLAYSKSTFKCVLLYPLLSRFSTSEFFRANRNVMRNRPVEKELRDLFPLSTSILIRLADVISDTDKGKRSFRAAKPFKLHLQTIHQVNRFCLFK